MNTTKTLTLIFAAVLVSGMAAAAPTIAVDYQAVNEKIWDTALGSLNDKAVWEHENPFEGDYQEALDAGCIDWVKLCIKAGDINVGDEQVAISFYDSLGNKQTLNGYLENGENCFYLDPTWLNGTNKVKAQIDYTHSSCLDLCDDACIVWSKLKVASNCPVIPAPGAIVLGSIGSFLVALIRGKKKS